MVAPEVTEAFATALESLRGGWIVSDGVIALGGLRVEISCGAHSDNPRHLDVRCELAGAPPGHAGLSDCVVGFGDTHADVGRTAAHIWVSTTASAILELQFSRRGEFASHYHGSEPDGLSGWHVIHGGILGYGDAEHGRTLQRWWVEHPFLPVLARAIAADLEPAAAPHGMKLFFGGDSVAEVSLNGVRHPAASDALLGLEWPRLSPPAFVRSYVLALHPEGS